MADKFVFNSLNEQAYLLIKERIINQEFTPGMRLVDSALAEQFGISRTPFRDAIRKLADEGLVIPAGKKGYCVFTPTVKDVSEIYEARHIIEEAAIRKLILTVIPQNPEALNSIEDAYQQTVIPDMDQKKRVEATEKFHLSIILPMDNSRLVAYYKDLLTQTRVFRCSTFANQEKQERTQRCHEKLFFALKNQDLKEALAALGEHNQVGIEIDIGDIKQMDSTESRK